MREARGDGLGCAVDFCPYFDLIDDNRSRLLTLPLARVPVHQNLCKDMADHCYFENSKIGVSSLLLLMMCCKGKKNMKRSCELRQFSWD
jgi:hypothetical protein